MQPDHSFRIQHIQDRLEVTRDRIYTDIDQLAPATYDRLNRTTELLQQAQRALMDARERLVTSESLRHDNHDLCR